MQAPGPPTVRLPPAVDDEICVAFCDFTSGQQVNFGNIKTAFLDIEDSSPLIAFEAAKDGVFRGWVNRFTQARLNHGSGLVNEGRGASHLRAPFGGLYKFEVTLNVTLVASVNGERLSDKVKNYLFWLKISASFGISYFHRLVVIHKNKCR